MLFHRVAIGLLADAIEASIRRAPAGVWACNVADDRDVTFGGLAGVVADALGCEWEVHHVPWAAGDHPWNVRHPIVVDTGRLRDVLGVRADALAATRDQVAWLWEHRSAAAALDPDGRGC